MVSQQHHLLISTVHASLTCSHPNVFPLGRLEFLFEKQGRQCHSVESWWSNEILLHITLLSPIFAYIRVIHPHKKTPI